MSDDLAEDKEPRSADAFYYLTGDFKELESLPAIDRELRTHPGPLARRFHQISVSIFLSFAKKFDLTPIQYGVLRVVEAAPGIHQAGLGKLVALDRQTISNVVRRLVEKGLLDRKKKNERTDALYLTGSSHALVDVMKGHMLEMDEAILRPLELAERDEFLRLLIKLVDGNNQLSRAPMSDR